MAENTTNDAEESEVNSVPATSEEETTASAADISSIEETDETEVPEISAMDDDGDEPITKVKSADDIVEREEAPEDLYSVADEQAFLTETGEFNWEVYERSTSYNDDERERYDTLYGNTLSTINEHEVVSGTVVNVGKKEVVVNIGYKSEGVIPVTEFRYNPGLKTGDVVPVYVEQQEDKNGQLIVSHKTARIFSAWTNVNTALETGEIIQGEVKCRTKGGLIVDVFGIEAFLPGSQIDVKPIRDYDIYVGKQMELKVVKINNEFKNVVVSHKALIEAELEEQKKQIMSGLEKGQVLEGVVKNITTYGVFVDLGGVDGLIHITDLSWGRINHPEELVKLDDKINVVILDFDDEKKRIALGMKQLQPHPWDALQDTLTEGNKVKGKVVVVADYGAFVEIAPGVEGLIHVSEMSWSQHLRTAQDFLKVGDEVDAVILNIDKDERKMSLGMKQLTPDPWENIETRYPVESKHNAKVRAFTTFGIFCELEEGIDGLIHISDLSWSKRIKHPSEFCQIGDQIDVVVLELDKENRRISLGHKQLEQNPWDVFETVFVEGSRHTGTILRKEGSTAIVALPYGVEGYCLTKNLKKADGSAAKVEEALEFVVTEFNKNQRRITLSHTRTYQEDEEPSSPSENKGRSTKGTSRRGKSEEGGGGSHSEAVKAVNAQVEKTTLGDLSVLSDLKDQMDSKTAKPKKARKADDDSAGDESTEEK